MPQRTHFIILYQGRAGSSFLVDSLANHAQVIAKPEILVRLRMRPAYGEVSLRPWMRFKKSLATLIYDPPAFRQVAALQQLYGGVYDGRG